MNYAQFRDLAGSYQADCYQEVLNDHRDSIKTKKDQTAVKNLELIFEATVRVANKKGFPAMTMRDLSQASGLSMGALYDYFSSKDELLEMVQRIGRNTTSRLLEAGFQAEGDPARRLAAAVRTHVYLSEVMQPWFFFSYMEARHLGQKEKELAKQSELSVEGIFRDLIREGQEQGLFAPVDPELTAAVMKAMVQDWYLKRWKYGKRKVGVDRYADLIVEIVLAYCINGKERAFPETDGPA